MSEHDDILKQALAENAQFKAEKADVVRKETTSEFRNKLRLAERIVWIYLMACVLVGVLALNAFEASHDTKTLLTCVIIFLVVYETTVLLKLWFVVAGTKLGVLKEMKQLRLEVSQLATAAGVTTAADVLTTKYEPIKGASRMERRLWLVALIVTAVLASSVASGGYDWLLGGGENLSADARITLAADGSAIGVTKIGRTYYGAAPLMTFTSHLPKSWKARWLDSQGVELPYSTTPRGDHIRYDISLLHDVESSQRLSYTRMDRIPQAAIQEEGVWTFASDAEFGTSQNEFSKVVLLPEGATLVGADPQPTHKFTSGGRVGLHFEGVRGRNAKFAFQVQYRLPSEASE